MRVPIDELMRIHQGKWFSEGALKWFSSRLPETAIKTSKGYFFITSEQYKSLYKSKNGPRMYTIRLMSLDGEQFDDVGGFQAFSTKAKAQTFLKNYLKDLFL